MVDNWEQKDIDYILSLCTERGKRQARQLIERGMCYIELFDYVRDNKLLLHLPSPNSSLFQNPGHRDGGRDEQHISDEEAKRKKKLKCDEVRSVLQGYGEQGELYFKDEWEFSNAYNRRYGFLKLAILLGSIIKFIRGTKKVRRIFGQSPNTITSTLQRMQIENSHQWYQHSGDVDVHGMNGKTAAEVIKDYICEKNSWTVIRFVFGQDRHGGDHRCFGTMKKLGELIFRAPIPSDIPIPDDYREDVLHIREVVHSTPPRFCIQFYAGDGAVQVKRLS